jgi:phosphoribosylformimino-5-aminoimidazole carboxamide ribotide isomerase
MDLYPAIDVRGGTAVRLRRGDVSDQTSYGDPVVLARQWLTAGAPWLHLVDIDAALSGEPLNRKVIMTISRQSTAPVQVGGGLRTVDDVTELLGAGVARVVLGTAALEDPSLLERCAQAFPGRVALGLDYRRRTDGSLEAAVRGWTQGSGRLVQEAMGSLPLSSLGAVVVTAIDRDGTLQGPDIDGLAAVLDSTPLPVVASGGVASADDLRALRDVRSPVWGRTVSGAIVGKALVEGRMTLPEAVAACNGD